MSLESDCSEWINDFISTEGNEFFCKVDLDYIDNKFNMFGLKENEHVHHYNSAIKTILGLEELSDYSEDSDCEKSDIGAELLYGLIHARYILTQQGLLKMVDKIANCDFGFCPRVLCRKAPVIPFGFHQNYGQSTMRLMCTLCQDIYHPSNHHDGSFWGPTFANLALLQASELNLFEKINEIRKIPLDQEPKPFNLNLFGFQLFSSMEITRKKLDFKNKLNF